MFAILGPGGGQAVNLDQIVTLYVTGSGSTWYVNARVAAGADITVSDAYASEAAAKTGLATLCDSLGRVTP